MIVVRTNMAVTGWTFENFKRWVKHEAMFFQSIEHTPDGYVLHREGAGYSGHPTIVQQRMVLNLPDGIMPDIDSPEREVAPG